MLFCAIFLPAFRTGPCFNIISPYDTNKIALSI